jgi:hypothetical protein
MSEHDAIPSGADDPPDTDLLPLGRLGSRSETEVVMALLKSSGIPAVLGGLYDPKAPKAILVPRASLEEANRLIADARSLNTGSAPPEPPPEEPRSIVTAITWVLGIALMAYVAYMIADTIYGLVRHWLR